MEQKHTLEENGYYAQVTDQLIENIGYQMIRRNWSMKRRWRIKRIFLMKP